MVSVFSPKKQFCSISIILVLLSFSLLPESSAAEKASAIFIFGDSTVDPGNNNFIPTIFRANFIPYGIDFPNHVPTGRFTNGKMSTDFLASYVGIKEFVPPYLDPSLSIDELMTGVSFASAGTGFDPLTSHLGNLIGVGKQLEYFNEYQKRIEYAIGKEKTKEIVENAVYIVSAGTNDFVLNYFSIPIRKHKYTIPAYMDFILFQVHQFIQGLMEQGARKIGFLGLPPMGCLPAVITLNSVIPISHRGCIDFFSSVAIQYNQKLQMKLNELQMIRLSDIHPKIVYMDVFNPFLHIINNGQEYNFTDVNLGCCGTGLLETSLLCNQGSYVCPDASKFMFWDSIHPTEKAYYLMFKAVQPAVDYLLKD
ncbi:GDSL esterase/lipase At5g45960-like [Impatiens glandulifera]|uniref:GDSL esterase/lipase At5g45960-like n=1 Tax=Impatiens glandulifera TaxID=253017 RepID=UPI001FB10DBE|nr:GDSL esterase/lipase At5g45960-like [Impatiens glandulifera]